MNLFSYYPEEPGKENVFQFEAPRIKFGVGAMNEVGQDVKVLDAKRVAVFTDSHVAKQKPMRVLTDSLKKNGVEFVVYDRCQVEPTDRSFKAATEFAASERPDGFVSLGGGSVIDTCKAANLYSSHPDEFLAYVNAPIGSAKPVPGKLKPHVSCPTTFGTASECTGIAIFDYLEQKAKTGMVASALRPVLGVLDPENLYSLPPLVTAANGFDVFSHACESYTARPYTRRNLPASPDKRPLSQGANPYSDFSCLNAIKIVGAYLVDTVKNPDYREGYRHLMFAGLLAGIGFGNAGCHLPHGMSYAVSGLVKNYRAEGWHPEEPLIPHGISVIVTSPSVFEQTAGAAPDRHRNVAEYMGADVADASDDQIGTLLKERLVVMMKEAGIPNGLAGVGYGEEDLDALTEGSFPQKRLLDNAPIDVPKAKLRELFAGALKYW